VESGKYDITLNEQNTSKQLDVSQPYGEKKQVIPFQKDNPAFESAVNNALQRIKDDGRMAALEQKWFKGTQETAAGQ
jgi:ABC-type amino acid transport substrate-binding protein